MTTSARPRLVIIGLDGADWALLRPLFEDGAMPNLKAFVRAGARALLESVRPTNSMSAWTSLMTGVNPGRHGVFDFVRKSRTPFKTGLTSSADIRAPTMFDVLSANGMRSCVIDMPPLYPPYEINGVMIGGIGAANRTRHSFAYPEDLGERVVQAVGSFHADVPWLDKAGHDEELVAELIALVDNRRQVSEFLLAEEDWDLFCTVFVAPDRAQHAFWRDLTEGGPRYALARSFYVALDEQFGRFLERLDLATTDVLIVSDHGFRCAITIFDVNQFFVEAGFTRWRWADRTLGRALRLIGTHIPLPAPAGRTLIDLHGRLQQTVLASSLAYSDAADGVSVNLAGRESTGRVPQAAFEEVRDQIADSLLAFRDPATGAPVLERLLRRDECLHGDYALEAPDLLLDFADGYAIGRRMGSVLRRWDHLQGVHSRNGIVAAAGPHFRRAIEAPDVSIMDIMPTVLSLLGVLPSGLDGRVAGELLAAPVAPVAGAPVVRSAPRAEPSGYSEEEEAVIRERLRGLGYIE